MESYIIMSVIQIIKPCRGTRQAECMHGTSRLYCKMTCLHNYSCVASSYKYYSIRREYREACFLVEDDLQSMYKVSEEDFSFSRFGLYTAFIKYNRQAITNQTGGRDVVSAWKLEYNWHFKWSFVDRNYSGMYLLPGEVSNVKGIE